MTHDFIYARPDSVMAHVLAHRNDRAYVPTGPDIVPTAEFPGSRAKADILAYRAAHGLELWHPDDRSCFDDKLI